MQKYLAPMRADTTMLCEYQVLEGMRALYFKTLIEESSLGNLGKKSWIKYTVWKKYLVARSLLRIKVIIKDHYGRWWSPLRRASIGPSKCIRSVMLWFFALTWHRLLGNEIQSGSTFGGHLVSKRILWWKFNSIIFINIKFKKRVFSLKFKNYDLPFFLNK